MKQFKSILAMLLVLVMVISCVGTAFAAKETPGKAVEKTPISALESKTAKTEKNLKGFKSPEFVSQNAYRYGEDETVRAIVVLKGAPEADVAFRGTTGAATQRARIQNEQAAVRKAMSGIDYEIAYEYTALLNGFSCDVAYGDLDKIAAIDGVEAVYIANTYETPVLEAPKTELPKMGYAGSNSYTGNTAMNAAGYNGKGMVIAVLDTGTRVTHQVLTDISLVEPTLTPDDCALAVADGTYVSAKIPFAYDYADKDNDVTDYNGHGTHVAGIATGYLPTEDGGVAFAGAAPAAQLLAMKIFHDDEPGTSSDIYFFALEDAYRLGADVVNMSIGSQNGFTYDAELETEVFGNIYERLSKAGVVLCIAAGNEYSMAENASFGYIGSDYADYGTVASPSTYNGALSVASVENAAYPSLVLSFADDLNAAYVDSSEEGLWVNAFAGQTLEYVVVPNTGAPEDYADIDVTDKIALVTRGGLTFEEKIENAANAGAIGCIICDNVAGLPISMQIETFEIPAVSVVYEVGEYMKSLESKTFSVPEGMVDIENPEAGFMSDFSNWGPDPMLGINPNFTSVGGHVWSSVNTGDDAYEVYSGTSMAAPNATGTMANLLQFLKEQGITDKAERAELAAALLESSATTIGGITEDWSFWFYSVRKQGAGVANAKDAMDAYTKSAYVANPIQELGDDPAKSGIYEMSLEVKNDGSESVTLTPFSVLMVDELETDEASGITYNTLGTKLYDSYGMTPGVTFSYSVNGEALTGDLVVPANSAVTLDVTIELDADLKAYLDRFENGTYVEGYVTLQDYDDALSAQATFLGFYGDWTKGPVLEKADFRDFLDANYFAGTEIMEGKDTTYAENGYTGLDFLDFYTMPNMACGYDINAGEPLFYLGDNVLDYAPFSEKHISFSTPATDAEYNYTNSMALTPYQLRNAKHLIMTVTDAKTGEVYYVDDTPYLPKAVFDSESGWLNYGLFVWDGKNADGDYVPSGTVAHVQFDAVLPYGDTEVSDVWSFDVTVDYNAPMIESIAYDSEAQTLTVVAGDDQYLQAIYLANDTDILDQAVFSSEKVGEIFTATFDVSTLIEKGNDEIYVAAIDYATNEVDEYVPLYEVGKDATVTLVTPSGETKYECKTGDTLTFPACDEEYEGCDFLLWTRTNEEKISEDDIWNIDGMFFEGDSITVKRDETFYALYAVGEEVPLEKSNYYATQEIDYSGDWAIGGLDFVGGDFDVSNPHVIGKDCEKVTVADLPDAEIGDWYIEFYTNAEGFRYTFEKVGEDEYTMKNLATGKYLALADGALTMADTVTPEAKWAIFANPESSAASIVYNVAEPDMVLVYDDEAQEFAIYDDTVPCFSYNGEDYYPSTWFSLWLYKCVDTEFVTEYYTTTMKATVHECYFDDFSDCTSAWYHEAVDYTVSEGLMQGIGDGKFDPNGTMTRAMMVTVLYRAVGAPEMTEPCSFTDVPEGQWYSDAIAWAQYNGIVLGVSTDKFAPNASITREQIATILWRFEDKPVAKADMSAFKDAGKISAYAADAMNWAVSKGILKGDNGNLKPTDFATRAEFACMIMRYLSGSYSCENMK